MKEPIKIFLSHSSNNFEKMLEFANELESRGHLCWYAPRNIPYGKNYLTEIIDAIDEIDVVVLFHSREVHDSKYVYREIQYADSLNKLIIPLMIDDADVSRHLQLIINTMQMLSLNNFLSITAAVDELQRHMEEYMSAKQDASSSWNNSFDKKISVSNSVQLGALNGFKVKQSHLEKIKDIYVPVPSFPELMTSLHDENLLILQSNQKTGKYTTALSLLQKLNCNSIIELLPNVSLLELLKSSLKPSSGYIVDGAGLTFFEESTMRMWSELVDQLQQANSFLVITTTIESSNEHIHHMHLPDLTALVERYANYYGIDQVLPTYLSRILPYIEGRTPEEIEGMIKQLVPVAKGKQRFEEAENRFQTNVKNRITKWFKENGHSIDLVSQYITLAIVKEATEREYIELAANLKEALKHLWQWQPSSSLPMFDHSTAVNLFAEKHEVRVNTDIGVTLEEGIRLKHHDEGNGIILTFWELFREVRPYFLQWLDSQARKTTNNHCFLEAISLLASRDFLHIRQELLQQWAKDDDINLRVNAVKVLSILATENIRTQEITNLIKSWGSQKNNINLLFTAVRALGSEIGLLMYPYSLDLLKRMILAHPKKLRVSARQSFINLSKLGEYNPSYDEHLFQFFMDWMKEEMLKENGGMPKTYLLFFFSILGNRVSTLLPADRISGFMYPYIQTALAKGETKTLAEDYLLRMATKEPSLIAPLVNELLLDSQGVVKERMHFWIKKGMQSHEKNIYMNLYSEVKKVQGGTKR
ncbi:toll/interleukin-1 receptor domain-containing protein [Rossellomorea aquimaris]|uniref:toll/interleukin-1 receptor domain-containing protein n=1 Tax=Rossellomorea aquimaris TaxID=189382 RepID=UPI001CD2DBDA|nr:toll/interleukin-1 receptor domain-containing protein [Rossellomorea aquimaris]MCA1060825.1 toll/interleukin-1 receptor domain-containing protein [Rossellomorea aquimaris]